MTDFPLDCRTHGHPPPVHLRFPPPQPADVYRTTDQFDATNNFFGGQLGARGRADWGA